MKLNRIVKFIHHLQLFISIQLLIKVARGALFRVAYISLLISEVRVVQKLWCETIFTKVFTSRNCTGHKITYIKESCD
jgi:hypothetical protein